MRSASTCYVSRRFRRGAKWLRAEGWAGSPAGSRWPAATSVLEARGPPMFPPPPWRERCTVDSPRHRQRLIHRVLDMCHHRRTTWWSPQQLSPDISDTAPACPRYASRSDDSLAGTLSYRRPPQWAASSSKPNGGETAPAGGSWDRLGRGRSASLGEPARQQAGQRG